MLRLLAALIASALLLGACGGSRLEVPTNSGGVLDCPTPTILYVMFDSDFTKPGAASPLEAAAAQVGGEFVPDGIPSLESESASEATAVVVDFDGNRVGRVLLAHHESSWHIQSTEACG